MDKKLWGKRKCKLKQFGVLSKLTHIQIASIVSHSFQIIKNPQTVV